MSAQEWIGIVTVFLGVIGYFFYFRGVLEGKVKPHAFSWFVWGLLTTIGFAAQLTAGAGPGSWVLGFTALMCFVATGFGLTSSARLHITRADWFYFLAALAAIPVWYFTGNPFWSVIIITVIDAVAFIPTFRKAYHHPFTENGYSYALSSLKFGLSLFALQTFSWTTVLYPASLVAMNAVFVIMLYVRHQQLRGNPRPIAPAQE